jgi:hypothetical protein
MRRVYPDLARGGVSFKKAQTEEDEGNRVIAFSQAGDIGMRQSIQEEGMAPEGASNKRIMQGDLADVYEGLYQEVSWLHAKWKIYQQVFGVSEEQIELLNRIAPAFFHIIQDVLQDEIALSLSRLTDPAQTGFGRAARDNLTLTRLIDTLRVTEPIDFCDSISASIAEIQAQCWPFRDLRNRTIAHADLSTALHYHPDPLPGISRKMIGDVLTLISNLLNRVLARFESAEVRYSDVVMQGAGDSVIYYLRRAEEYNKKSRGDFTTQ